MIDPKELGREFELDVWGVGRVVVGDEVVPWPVSPSDVADEAESLVAHIESLGVTEADVIVLCSLLSQTIHVFPLEVATNKAGARYSSTDATPFDAFRTAAMIRQLGAVAALGVSTDTVAGLAEAGRDLAEVFGPLRAVATADDEAHAALTAAGLEPRRWIKLGPTSALECGARAGAHYDGGRWQVDVAPDGDGAGELLLTNLVDRYQPCAGLRTGLSGSVTTDACPCGRPGPRIVLS